MAELTEIGFQIAVFAIKIKYGFLPSIWSYSTHTLMQSPLSPSHITFEWYITRLGMRMSIRLHLLMFYHLFWVRKGRGTRNQIFTDKQKIREFSTTKPAFQQMLKEFLYASNTREGKDLQKRNPKQLRQWW